MVYKQRAILKSGEEIYLETDQDLVKDFAMFKSGVDFDAPPATPYDGMGNPTTPRDQPMAMRGVSFVGNFFAIDLGEVAFVERLADDHVMTEDDMGED